MLFNQVHLNARECYDHAPNVICKGDFFVMDKAEARSLVANLRREDGNWVDECHLATDTFRDDAIKQLNADDSFSGTAKIYIVCAEIFTRDPHPQARNFEGIIAVNDTGIWFYDGDGSVDDAAWRQYLLPWHNIASVILHQAS
jgi:hypothetical protein